MWRHVLVSTHACGSESLVVSWGTGEDAPVEVLETRMRRRPTPSRHRPTSGAIIAALLEISHQ
jgi:hypothetical protein